MTGRLADKIAIMKDGAVVQQGTPEEIVLHPATDYVAEFTRAVPRAKVVRVDTIMKPPSGEEPAAIIAPGSKVADAAPLLQLTLYQVRNFREVYADSYLRLVGVFEKK